MPTKTLNIAGCPDHKKYFPNQLELIYGFKDRYYVNNCVGCLNQGYVAEANSLQTIYLTFTILNSDGNKIKTHYFCHPCSLEFLKKQKQVWHDGGLVNCYCSHCSIKSLSGKPDRATVCYCFSLESTALEEIRQYIIYSQREEYQKRYEVYKDKRNLL